MNRKEQIIFGILGLFFAAFSCIAAWLLVPSIEDIFSPPIIADPPTQPPPPTIMDNIYNSLRLESLVADKVTYTRGEEVVFSYKLTNISNQTLVIPENNDYSRPTYLVGAVQGWIERLGSDNNIPSISDETRKDGARYASGLSVVIPVEAFLHKRVIEPAESLTPQFSLRHTSGYPPGMYRFYIEYQRLDGSVIHTLSLDFEIRSPDAQDPPTPITTIPTPNLVFIKTEENESGGVMVVDYYMGVTNWQSFPDYLFEDAPDLPPCGSITDASRTWVETYNADNDEMIHGFCTLNSSDGLDLFRNLSVRKGSVPPSAVYVIIHDRLTDIEYRSNNVSIP